MDQEVEKIEQHYLKYILQLPSTATKAAVRGELGQLPVHLFWKERILKYWFRLNKDDIPILLHEALLIHRGVASLFPRYPLLQKGGGAHAKFNTCASLQCQLHVAR